MKIISGVIITLIIGWLKVVGQSNAFSWESIMMTEQIATHA